MGFRVHLRAFGPILRVIFLGSGLDLAHFSVSRSRFGQFLGVADLILIIFEGPGLDFGHYRGEGLDFGHLDTGFGQFIGFGPELGPSGTCIWAIWGSGPGFGQYLGSEK